MIEPKQLDINIKENLKIFFLEEVLGGCDKLKDGPNMKNSILILDGKTSRVLDKFLGIIDLIEWGVVGIENLYRKRKGFKQFHAVYFVEPSEESINLILKDFNEDRPEERNEAGQVIVPGGPLYDFAHIIVCGNLGEALMHSLSSCKPLVYALLSIRQINLDIHVVDENIYDLKFKDDALLLNKNVTDRDFKLFHDLSNQALSILTLVRKVEYVQLIYQIGGPTELFAKAFDKKLQFLVNNIPRIGRVEVAPIYFFVLNRGSDLLSLLARDNSYASMYFNVLGKTDYKIEYEVDNDGKKITQTAPLNESDPIWLNYKYLNFNEAKLAVSTNLKAFIAANKKTNRAQKAEDQLKSLPQYQEFIRDFSKHITAMNSITQIQKDKKFSTVYEYEQGIITGKRKNGEKFEFASVKKADVEELEDRLRLAVLGYFAGTSQEVVIKTLLENQEEIAAFKLVINTFEKSKLHAVDSVPVDDLIESKESQYWKPKAVDYLLNLIRGNFWENPAMKAMFNKITVAPKGMQGSSPFEKNLFKQNAMFKSNDQSPIVIFFFLGGVGMAEIKALNALAAKKDLADFRLVVGGSSVWTSHSLLKQFIKDMGEEAHIKEERSNVVDMKD